jgi:hypothetical protein
LASFEVVATVLNPIVFPGVYSQTQGVWPHGGIVFLGGGGLALVVLLIAISLPKKMNEVWDGSGDDISFEYSSIHQDGAEPKDISDFVEFPPTKEAETFVGSINTQGLRSYQPSSDKLEAHENPLEVPVKDDADELGH